MFVHDLVQYCTILIAYFGLLYVFVFHMCDFCTFCGTVYCVVPVLYVAVVDFIWYLCIATFFWHYFGFAK